MATKIKPGVIEWISEIHCMWDCEKLKYHATINPTIDLKEIEFDDDIEVSFVPMEHLHSGFHDHSTIAFSQVKSGYTVFSEGDILLAKVTPCFENGNIAIAEDLIKGVGFGSTEILTIRCNSINPRFTYYCLQNPTFKARAVAEMYGVAGLKRIPLAFLENSFFPFPSSATQQRIADYLDQKCGAIDKVISAKQRQNELLKEQRQSIIYDTVTKGLDKNAPYKDSGIEWIGEIPKDWEICKIKYICEVDKNRLPENTDENFLFNYIDIRSVTELGGIGDTIRMSFKESPSRARMVVSENDIIISTVRTYLRAIAFITENDKYICSTGFAVLTPKENLNSKFAFYQVQSEYIVQEIVRRSVGVSYPAITATALSNISLIIPPLSIQRVIADYLDQKCAAVDRIINANNDMIEKLQEYRQSIVYEAVTGKIDI